MNITWAYVYLYLFFSFERNFIREFDLSGFSHSNFESLVPFILLKVSANQGPTYRIMSN